MLETEQAPGARPTGEPVLTVNNLVKHFPLTRGILFKKQYGSVQAVDGINFELGRGETLGIVGESGCGKSTVAKLLMRLEEPTSGSVNYEDQDIFAMRAGQLRTLRRNVQMILQDPYASLNPRMTVGDIVGEPFEIHPDAVPRDRRRARVQELLELVGLNPDHVNRYPHQFSGGQRQRIGIARAIALNPKVVICDEPVSALDVSVQAQVLNLLEQLQDELGLSYVFISHDLTVVQHLCDRVAVMYLGRFVELGTADQVYGQPAHPYTQALLSAAPLPDPTLRERHRIMLEGDPPSPADPPSGCRFRTRCWKAQDICAQEDPALVPRSTDHPDACHFSEVTKVTA